MKNTHFQPKYLDIKDKKIIFAPENKNTNIGLVAQLVRATDS